MKRKPREPRPCTPLSLPGIGPGTLEELEIRLEARMLIPEFPGGSPDQGECVYYFCSMRCGGTKCTSFGPAGL